MVKVITDNLIWIGKLTRAFVSGAPVATLAVVFLTLISQVLTIFAFLLPLKVVMILGTSGIPRFLPSEMAQYDKDVLVLSLGSAAIICFLVNIIVVRVIQKISTGGAQRLQQRAQKLSLFENQNSIAGQAYLKYAEALASLVFTLLAITLLFVIYSDIASLLLVYLSCGVVILLTAAHFNPKLRQNLLADMQKYLAGVSSVGFLGGFVFVVIDFLYLVPPVFYVAIIAVILLRRTLGLMVQGVNSYVWLKKKQDKINPLFFRNKVFIEREKVKPNNIWQLVSDARQNGWLSDVLSEALMLPVKDVDVCWQQHKLKHVQVLDVRLDKLERRYLVKIFDTHKSLGAQHEEVLIRNASSVLPIPPLVVSKVVSERYCHIFDVTSLTPIKDKLTQAQHYQFCKSLLKFIPSSEFVSQYRRSRVLLAGRIDDDIFERLSIVGGEQQKQLIECVQSELPQIKKMLRLLPLGLWVPVEPTLMYIDVGGAVSSCHWTKWCMEPIGYGWEGDEASLLGFKTLLDELSSSRPELNKFAFEYYELVIYVSQLEREYTNGRYLDAIETVKKIDGCLKRLE